MYGPMTVGCAVMVLPDRDRDARPPAMWELLGSAVCDRLRGRRGRLAINDSKMLTTKAAGIKHLEIGLLAFERTRTEMLPADVGDWLDRIGEARHRESAAHASGGLNNLPWYAVGDATPWQKLPSANTDDELTLAGGMLARCCNEAGVRFEGYRVEVIYEDQLNRRVALTRSKAAVSFTAVARHLDRLMRDHGQDHPHVAVDRQSGRTRYRDLLATLFEGATIDILGETPQTSAYRIRLGDRCMTVSFMVGAESLHMPVALASMSAKCTREFLMERFNNYFADVAPAVKPTAGYGSDANRWRDEILPHLAKAGIDHRRLRRNA